MIDQETKDKLIRDYEIARDFLNNKGHGRTLSEAGLKGERDYLNACGAMVRAGLMAPLKRKYRPSIKKYGNS